MRLSQHSEYALRLLIHTALRDPDLTTVRQTAAAFGISATHLQKVAQTLAAHGFLTTLRGRSGGLRLARLPHAIRVGEVVATTEPDFQIAPCMPPDGVPCPIYGPCVLHRALSDAARAFIAELDKWTLADLIREKDTLLTALTAVSGPTP